MKQLLYLEFSNLVHSKYSESGPNRTPLEGSLELTRLCSIRCTHCYIGDSRWKRDPNELSTSQVKAILDVIAERGTLWLCITGGEPLIRKDFREIWLYAKSKGFILTLFTNATLIDESMAEFLEQNPPFNLEVSIYGATETTYEQVSQIKGSFKRFMRGIDNIRSRELSWRMKTVLIRENQHELAAMQSLASEWGVQFRFDGYINPSIGQGKTGGLAPCASRAAEELIVTKDYESEDKKNAATQLVQSVRNEPRENHLGADLFSCGAGKNSFYIDSQGLLQMCILTGHRGHSLISNRAIDQEFDLGWRRFYEVRKLKRDTNSPCNSCDIAALCDNCPGFAFLETGNEQSVVEFLCKSTHIKAEKLNIPHQCDERHFFNKKLDREAPNENRSEKKEASPLCETRDKKSEAGCRCSTS